MATTSKHPFPGEAEIDSVEEALRIAHDEVERIVWGVEAAADSTGSEPDCPPITVAEIGVVAVIADDVETRIEELRELRRRLARALFALASIRSQQLYEARDAPLDD